MIYYKRYIIFIIIVCSFCPCAAGSWTGLNETYLQKVWTIASGLPQNTIQCLVQSPDGYLWIGTPAGLVRFDGIKFTGFNQHTVPLLKNKNILSLYVDHSQVLWIGTDGGGLYSVQDGKWENFSSRQGLSNDHVRAIISDWQNDLWVGTDYGLNRLNGSRIEVYTVDEGLPDNIITTLGIDNAGCIWAGTLQGGAVKIDRGSMRLYDANDGLGNQTIRTIHTGRDGSVWLGTLEGLYRRDQFSDLFEKTGGKLSGPITDMVENENGQILISSMAGGLQLLEKHADEPDLGDLSLPDKFIHCLLRDRKGHIWIGTDTEGLIQLKVREVQEITSEQGLPENGISTLLEDKQGNLWIAMRNSGLCKLSPDGQVTPIKEISGLFTKRICALYEDPDGTIWCGTKNNGLFNLRNNKLYHLEGTDSLAGSGVTSLARDSKGKLWIGTGKGFYSLRYGHNVQRESNILKSCRINILCVGNDQSLYAGTENGVYHYRQDAWHRADSSLSADVFSLYEDKDGILWVGTREQGLKWYNHERLYSFAAPNKHFDDSILSVYVDRYDFLWMSTTHGVAKLKRETLLYSIDDPSFELYPCCYDENEGMPSRQCIGNVSPAVLRTRNNRLLYPTVKGIAVFNLAEINSDTLAPEIIVEKLLIDSRASRDENFEHTTFAGKNYEIDFTAIDFSAPGKLNFEYMLEGYDSAFTRLPVDHSRHLSFRNLEPGRYKLILRVVNQRGIKNQHASILTFHVPGPYYAHPVFIMSVMMVALMFSSVFFYFRYKKRVSLQVDKYRTSRINREISEQAKEKIATLMVSEKLYLNPDLNLQDLSSRLNLHPNYISRIINEEFQMSYNDYVNRHRIEDAKRKLEKEDEKSKTILEIMYDTGFYSKSVFNTAFKKFTGMTPSEYRRLHV